MSTETSKCLECDNGTYAETVAPFLVTTQDGISLEIPDVIHWRCDLCGDEIIPPESSRKIERFVANAEDRFSPTEVKGFLNQFQVDQTEASQILGFGAKTLNRWATGAQTVSRSMGYYLRALQRFPEVFEWLRQRPWQEPQIRSQYPEVRANSANHIPWSAIPIEERFPKLVVYISVNPKRPIFITNPEFNPALGLTFARNR